MTTTKSNEKATAGGGPAIGIATVADAMNPGVMACNPGASLEDLAAAMLVWKRLGR